MEQDKKPPKRTLGVIGVGNTIAGDDGAGVVVMRRLRRIFSENSALFFHELSGDLFEMSDRIHEADYFIFCDVIVGESPGKIKRMEDATVGSQTPSFHQTDITAVMRTLRSLDLVTPFPQWELWAISITTPRRFSAALSPRISRAVKECVAVVAQRIQEIAGASGSRSRAELQEGLVLCRENRDDFVEI